MKVLLIGASRRVGVGKESNKPYDICRVHYLIPNLPGNKVEDGKQIWSFEAHGYRPVEMDCNPAALAAYPIGADLKQVELIIEPTPNNPAKNWVVGFGK